MEGMRVLLLLPPHTHIQDPSIQRMVLLTHLHFRYFNTMNVLLDRWAYSHVQFLRKKFLEAHGESKP